MTPEERDKRLEPELKYADTVQQIEDLPAFNREQAYSDWRSGKKPLLDALMSNYVKPERQITPEQAKRAKTAAAISDSLATLAQMFAHSQGARVRNPQGKTSMQTTNERLQAMQNKYEQDMLRYGTARANAEMQDFNQYLRDAMNAHGQKRQNILLKAQYAQQLAQAREKAAADEAKYKRDQADKTAAADKKFERDMALVRERAKYRSSGGGGGSRSDKPLPYIYLNAHKDDPDAVVDHFGRRVAPVNLTKDQLTSYGNMALADKEFNEYLNGMNLKISEYNNLDKKRVKGNIDFDQMAHLYAQYLYDKGFQPEGGTGQPQQPIIYRSLFQPEGGWGNYQTRKVPKGTVRGDMPAATPTKSRGNVR